MKKFKFRLEKIRKYKKQIENDIKLQLAAERARLFVEAQRLDDLNAFRSGYFNRYGVRRTGKVNVHELKMSRMFLDKLASEIRSQADILDKARVKVNEVQKKLGDASRERKKYDRLKEKSKAQYGREMTRLETKELDEFGSRRQNHSNAILT